MAIEERRCLGVISYYKSTASYATVRDYESKRKKCFVSIDKERRQRRVSLSRIMAAAVYMWVLCAYLVDIVHSYSLDYKGFDNCGIGGWRCRSNATDYEVIYECSDRNMEVRLWLWTARIPSRTTVYGVSNCRHIELHFDCTMGFRSYTLKQFRVTNVTTVEILAPLRSHVFLHDNDEIAHAPPDLVFTNVTLLKWADRTFEKALAGRCRTRQQFMKRISFDTVTLDSLGEDAFSNLTLESFAMKGVVFTGLTMKSILVTASQTIHFDNTNFAYIPTESLQLQADVIVFDNSKIGKIENNGISVKTRIFQFSGNKVGKVEENAISALARTSNFSGNHWEILKPHAFAGVAPGERISLTYILAEKFTFQFSDNKIDALEENSLHPNYHAYKRLCSSIIVENNSVPCTCSLPFEDPAMNKSREWWQFFYGELVLTESNYCTLAPNCSLQQTLIVLQKQECSPQLHPEAICSNITAKYYTPTEHATSLDPTSPPMPSTKVQFWDATTETPHAASAVNTNSGSSQSVAIVTYLIVAVLSVALLIGIMFYVYKKMNKSAIKVDANYQRRIEDDDEEGLITDRFDATILRHNE